MHELVPLFHRLALLRIRVESVLHIGANRGEEINFYREAGLHHGTFIEADPDVFQDLKVNVASEPGFSAVNALLGETDGEKTKFYRATNDGLSSSMLQPSAHLREHPEVGFDEPIILTTTSLDSLSLPQHDLIVIDVQGAEMQVLRGGFSQWINALAIWSEVSVIDLYEGDTSLKGLIDFLDEHGFFLCYVDINQNLWGNALFVSKKYLAFRNSQ